MLKGLFILSNTDLIYGGDIYEAIKGQIELLADPMTKDELKNNSAVLEKAEVLFSGWGCPVMDADFLRRAPNLKTVFYGAGSIKFWVTDAFWDRGIRVTSAYAANAVPVAEYAAAQIILSLKQVFAYMRKAGHEGRYIDRGELEGAYLTTVGIISLGIIGRMVCERLKTYDVKVIACDPFIRPEVAADYGVELCGLEEVFARADVVSLHTPWLKETENLIGKVQFSKMKQHATFINTARGAIVNEQEMIEVLQERQDLSALLDVTYPEPPAPDSPLLTMENVFLTPHVAGSVSAECRRMGTYMLAELERYLQGKPMKWEITREKAAIMA